MISHGLVSAYLALIMNQISMVSRATWRRFIIDIAANGACLRQCRGSLRHVASRLVMYQTLLIVLDEALKGCLVRGTVSEYIMRSPGWHRLVTL